MKLSTLREGEEELSDWAPEIREYEKQLVDELEARESQVPVRRERAA